MRKRLLLSLVSALFVLCGFAQDLTPAYGVVTFEDKPTSNDGTAGDITQDTDLGIAGEFQMIVSPKASGTTNNRFWKNAKDGVIQLRVYNGSITFKAAEGKKLTRIEFTKGSTWTDPIFSTGSIDSDTKVWTPADGADVTELTVSVASQIQMSKVTVGELSEPAATPEAANIAAFKQGEQGAEQRLTLTDAVVTFNKDDNIFVEDATGAICFYQSGLNQFMPVGMKINGTILGAYKSYQDMPQFNATDNTITDFAAGMQTGQNTLVQGEAVPTEVAIADLVEEYTVKPEYLCRYLVIKNAEAQWDYQSLKQGEDEVGLADQFGVLPEGYKGPSKVASIDVIAGSLAVYPVSADKIIAAQSAPATVCQNIAALKAVTVGEAAVLDATVKVTYQGLKGWSSVCYLEDATGAIAISGDLAMNMSDLMPAITAGATCQVKIYGNVAEDGKTVTLTMNDDIEKCTATAVEGAPEVVPTVMTVEDALKEENINRYIEIKDATINADGFIPYLVQGEAQIAIEDEFWALEYDDDDNVVLPTTKILSAKVLVANSGTDNRINPVAPFVAEEEQTTPEIPATRKWDFTKWSLTTQNNMSDDAFNAEPNQDTRWRTFEKADGTGDQNGKVYWWGTKIETPSVMTAGANAEPIAELEGLLFTCTAGNLAVAYQYPETSLGTYHNKAYLWLGGSTKKKTNATVTIPSVAPGSKITLYVESHKPGTARGVTLTAGDATIGEAIPAERDLYTFDMPETITEPVDVVLTNNDGCHLYNLCVSTEGEVATAVKGVSVKRENADQQVYTIGGVRVSNTNAKGIYIIGGKKIVK